MAQNTTNDPTLDIKTDPAQPKWLTIPRVLLGLILIYKGYTFFKDSAGLKSFLSSGMELFSNNTETWALIITFANILGGLFLAWGLFTRYVAIIEIPILAGALYFIFVKGMEETDLNTVITVASFILLLVFAIVGSGPISADEYFRNYTKAGVEPGHTKEFLQ